MSKKLLCHQFILFAKIVHIAVLVPDTWDYWTSNGERVNFRIEKLNNPKFPNYTGFHLILGVFNLYFVWEKSEALIDT
jgi:hypothetical protein